MKKWDCMTTCSPPGGQVLKKQNEKPGNKI
jgi:hypothetical protein